MRVLVVLAHLVESSDTAARAGRVVLQSRTTVGASPTVYLVRVIVDVDRRPAEIVTVYRTTKLAKYWRDEP